VFFCAPEDRKNRHFSHHAGRLERGSLKRLSVRSERRARQARNKTGIDRRRIRAGMSSTARRVSLPGWGASVGKRGRGLMKAHITQYLSRGRIRYAVTVRDHRRTVYRQSGIPTRAKAQAIAEEVKAGTRAWAI
jgi:hypothetical protein